MGKIDELIQKYCPDGCEYSSIGDLCDVYTGGEAPDDCVKGSNYSAEKPYPVYSNGIEERALYGYSATYTIGQDAVTFSSIGTIGHPTIRKAGFTPIIRLKVIIPKDTNVITLSFLKYALELASFKSNKSSLPNVNASMIKAIEIPIPPLPVQEEIVRILDKFTELETELKTKLETELDLRKKQYEYYRDYLCTFDDTVPKMSLEDLFTFKNGINKEKSCFGHGTPIVNFTDVYNKARLFSNDVLGLVAVDDNELKRFKVEKNDVFFTRTSETIEDVGFASVIVEIISDCIFSGFLIKGHPITNLLLPEYCSYCFRTSDFRREIVGKAHMTTRATITGEILKSIEIAVPSIEEQKHIVDILDKFNALTNDITEGLPAEIKMRHQQYEHYRDKLLTFKRLEVS